MTLGPRFHDGLGVRVVEIDTASGDTVEVLHLTPELASFERSIKERTSRLVTFRHPRFVPVRGVEAVSGHAGRLGVVSDHVVGLRLSEILETVRTSRALVDANAALQLVRELLAAVSVLHDSRSVTHGAIGPERLILTPRGRLVIADYCLGLALERLQYSRQLLWRNYRIPVSVGAGIARFDKRVDVIQVGCVALALLVGKAIDASAQGTGLKSVIDEAVEATAHGERKPLSSNLRAWLERMLPIETRKPFATAQQANVALEQLLVKERRFGVAPAALRAFVGRVIAAPSSSAGGRAGLAATAAPEVGSAVEAADVPASVEAPAPVVPDQPSAAAAAETIAPATDDRPGAIVSTEVLASIAPDLDRLGDPVLRAILGVPGPAEGSEEIDEPAEPQPTGVQQAASPEPAATDALPAGGPPPEPSLLAADIVPAPPDDGLPIVLDEEETREQLVSLPADRDDELLPSAAGVPEPASAAASVDLEVAVVAETQPAAEPDEVAPANLGPPDAIEETPAPEPEPLVLDATPAASCEPPVEPEQAASPEPTAGLRGEAAGEAAQAVDEASEGEPEPAALEPPVPAALAVDEEPAVEASAPAPESRLTEGPAVEAAPADVAPPTRISDADTVPSGGDASGDAVLMPPREPVATANEPAPGPAAVEDVWVINAADLTLDASLLRGLRLAPNVSLSEAWPLPGAAEAAASEQQVEPAPPLSSLGRGDAAFDEIIAHVIAASSSLAPQSVAPPPEETVGNAEGASSAHETPEEAESAPTLVAESASERVEVAVIRASLPEQTEAAAAPVDETASEPAVAVAGVPMTEPAADLSLESAADIRAEDRPATFAPRADIAESTVAAGEIGDDFVAARDGLRQFISSIRAKWFRHGAATARGEAWREVGTGMAPRREEPSPAIEEPAPSASTDASELVAEDRPAEAPEAAANVSPAVPAVAGTVSAPADVPEFEASPPGEPSVGPEPVALAEPASVREEPPVASEPAPHDIADGGARAFEAAEPLAETRQVAADRPSVAEPEEVRVASSLVEEREVVGAAEPPVAEAEASVEPQPAGPVPVEQEPVATEAVQASDLPAVLPIAVEVIGPAPVPSGEVDTSWAPPAPVPEGSARQIANPADASTERPKLDAQRVGRRHSRRRRRSREAEQAGPVLQFVPRERHDDDSAAASDGELPRTTDVPEPQVVSVEPSAGGPFDAGPPDPAVRLDAAFAGVEPIAESQGAPVAERLGDADLSTLNEDRPVPTPGGILFGTTEEPEEPAAQVPHDALASARVVAISARQRLARLAREVPGRLAKRKRDRRSTGGARPARRPARRPSWKVFAAAAVILAAAGTVAFGRGALASMPWLKPSAPTGTLVVETTPPGLEVSVDSAPKGTTPLTLTLPEGDHSIEVRGRGLSRTLPVRVVEGVRAVERLTWPVSLRTGTLRVDSEPPGATVRIDGQARGKTPLTVELPARVHSVELEGRGGRAQQSVRIEPERMTGVKIALFSGWMAVFAPVDVEIYESGRLLGTTEVERIMMPSGRHQIEFVNRRLGYRETRAVSIVPGDVTAVSLELPKGTLQIDLPAGYEVWLDGERVGETPLEPLDVSLGTHEVRLRHPMFGDRRQVVVVSLSERVRLTADTLPAR